jgi:hypothetical protein
MHKKLILGAILALVLAVTGVSLAFAGDDENGNNNGDGARVIHITLSHEEQHDFDLGASGPSAGDRFTVYGDVVRNGERVGPGGYECVTVHFTPGATPNDQPQSLVDLCTATLTLRGGIVTAQGIVDRATAGPGPVALAITGGTGAYRTAHGQAETTGPNEQGDEPLTLRLILNDD